MHAAEPPWVASYWIFSNQPPVGPPSCSLRLLQCTCAEQRMRPRGRSELLHDDNSFRETIGWEYAPCIEGVWVSIPTPHLAHTLSLSLRSWRPRPGRSGVPFPLPARAGLSGRVFGWHDHSRDGRRRSRRRAPPRSRPRGPAGRRARAPFRAHGPQPGVKK